MSIDKVLKQERQLADAIASVFTDEKYEMTVDELISSIRVEQNSLTLARAVFEKVGLRSAYDAMLDNAVEDMRIEQMIEKQHPKAAEAVKKLRAEFGALPVDGLRALRMLLDSAISEKELTDKLE